MTQLSADEVFEKYYTWLKNIIDSREGRPNEASDEMLEAQQEMFEEDAGLIVMKVSLGCSCCPGPLWLGRYEGVSNHDYIRMFYRNGLIDDRLTHQRVLMDEGEEWVV